MFQHLTPTARRGCALLVLVGCSAEVDGDTGMRPQDPPSTSASGTGSGGATPLVPGGSGSAPGSTGTPVLPAAPGGAVSAGGSGSVVSEPGTGSVTLDPNALPPRVLPLGANGFLDLAPARGEPFDRAGATALDPPAPAGWSWYPVPGTSCRDGSEAGLFLRFTDSKRLMIFFEGGGACTTSGFCNFNPQSVNHLLSGTGETVLGTVLGAQPGRQQPGVYQNNELTGVFSADRTENPFHDWNIAYIPYCTGDVHFGSRQAASVPGVAQPQKFVGALNTEKFVGRLVPTFEAGLERVVVMGASAGSFGAALNFSMISDAFAGVQADAILDSGVPFEDQFWPACMQKSWRALFGLDYGLPPDCKDCFNEDGGGLLSLSDFLIDKHPTAHIALISSMQDEVIRLFFTPGENQCSTITSADPVAITIGQIGGAPIFPAATYESGLLGVRSKYLATGRLASFFLTGANLTLHQHTMRPRFFDTTLGSVSMAQFVTDFLNGKMDQVGP
jgi:Pectinacetylesterase